MKFALTEIAHRLQNVNPRPEIHGEEKKAAADLELNCMLHNKELDQLHPQLRKLLYLKDTSQPDLISGADDDHITLLQFPQIKYPFGWDGEIVGAKVTIHRGIGPKSDLVLDGVVVNKFRVEPIEGGSVGLTYRVQFHPDEKAIGKLCMLTGTDVVVSLTPPDEETEAAAE